MYENESGDSSEEDKNFVASKTGGEVEDTAEEISFLESEGMKTLTDQVVEALKNDTENAGELAVEWKHRADENASQLSGEEYDYAMIDMMIAQANIWRESGDMDNYYDDLEQAREYANNMGFDDKVKAIDALLDS